MKIRSVKVNYLLNIFRIAFGTLVSLFTIPYINRVLGAEGLGKVEYYNSIIAYFVMASALGIPMYGIRETAKVRDSVVDRTKLLSELVCILIFTSIAAYVIIICSFVYLDIDSNDTVILCILSSMIILSNMGVEWFYQGLENQLFITIRYLLVRITSLIILFLFVKSVADIAWYAVVLVVSTVGSNIFNIIYLRKFTDLSKIKVVDLEIKKHLRPILTIFIASISTSIYLQLDNVMLGSLAGNLAVGYYALANKLLRFAILFVTTLGAVMLPRLSHLIVNDKDEYYSLAQKAMSYIWIIAIPSTILLYFMSKDFILLMGGSVFEESILTMKLLSPLIVIVGLAYFIGFLVLYPIGKEKIYTKATILSAITSIALNFYFIPQYHQNGAAIVAVISELMGVIVMFIFAKSELARFKFVSNSLIKYIIGSFSMILSIYLISYYFTDTKLLLLVIYKIVCSVSLFIISLIVLKDAIILDIIKVLRSRFLKKNHT